MKKRDFLVLDLDDTLVATTPALCELQTKRTGVQHDIASCTSHGRLWGLERHELVELMDLHLASGATRNPPFIPNVIDCLHFLSRHFRLAVITARNEEYCFETRRQLRAAGCDFHRVHHATNRHGTIPKSQICLDYGYEMIIDDHLTTANECAASGIRAFLFGTYPWNTQGELHSNVQRVLTWPEICQLLIPAPRD